jgi:hypothetical protein
MDTANADTTWTRKWLGLLDEGVSVGVNTSVGASTSPVVFSSQASTPLHPNASEDADQPSGLHSPSSSSTDLSDDAGLTYSDEWRDGVDVKGKGRAKPGDQGQDLEADEDEGPRSLPTELVMQVRGIMVS